MTGKVFQYENHYEMKKNRLKVLEEADRVCQHCGGTATVVHHIDNSTSNHSPENLMPLCQKCHSRLHASDGKINPHEVDEFTAILKEMVELERWIGELKHFALRQGIEIGEIMPVAG